MIAVENVVLVLLAAGRSSRFGDADKLEQVFLGKPLGLHVVTALEGLPFRHRVAVTDGRDIGFAARGYQVICNDRTADGMAHSVKLGVEQAKVREAEAVLIALADMPRITAAHIYRLLDAADSADAVVVSSDGRTPMPPGVFGHERFDFLLSLTGDQGARELVQAGRHVVTTPAELIDVDTPDDLRRLRDLVHAPEHGIARAAVALGDVEV